MKHLLSAWPEVAADLAGASRVLLVSDFDGTLTPIVARPELAKLSPETRRLLSELAGQDRFKVGVISGRALADLKTKINLEGLIYAGNHGLEIEGPDGLCHFAADINEMRPFYARMRADLGSACQSIRGAWVEEKGLSLSVHYRQAENARAAELRIRVEKALAESPAGARYRLTAGKKVLDVRPLTDWDKGRAIQYILAELYPGGTAGGLLAVYLGDDITDEDGFRAVEALNQEALNQEALNQEALNHKTRCGGLSVFVGEPAADSSAGFYLQSPAEVNVFLSRLLEYSRRGSLCRQYSR